MTIKSVASMSGPFPSMMMIDFGTEDELRLICPFAPGPDSDTRLRCTPFAYSCWMRLRDIMSVGVVTVGPEQTAKAALTEMRGHGIRHLVVVDRGRVVGILSERDLGGKRKKGRTFGGLERFVTS